MQNYHYHHNQILLQVTVLLLESEPILLQILDLNWPIVDQLGDAELYL